MEIQQIVPSTEILFVHTSYTIGKFGKTKFNELKVQCEDCCSQIFIFKPNKFAAASVSVTIAQPFLFKEIDKPNRKVKSNVSLFIQLSCVKKKILKMLVYHIYQLKIKQLECNRKKKAS
jgi:hypothetical protein